VINFWYHIIGDLHAGQATHLSIFIYTRLIFSLTWAPLFWIHQYVACTTPMYSEWCTVQLLIAEFCRTKPPGGGNMENKRKQTKESAGKVTAPGFVTLGRKTVFAMSCRMKRVKLPLPNSQSAKHNTAYSVKQTANHDTERSPTEIECSPHRDKHVEISLGPHTHGPHTHAQATTNTADDEANSTTKRMV